MEAVRNMYFKIGVENFYIKYGNEYKNPHEETIHTLLKSVTIGNKVLDLCCGSGEVTKMFLDKDIIGCDPFTYELYEKETSKPILKYDFKDIAQGKLSKYSFDTVICSFALHLCEVSMLDTVLYQLSRISNKLIIITPHKKPYINNNYWNMENEVLLDRVRLREYSKKDINKK